MLNVVISALTSFAPISSLLSDAAKNQDGGISLEFQITMKQKNIGPKSKTISKKCLELNDIKFDKKKIKQEKDLVAL